MAHEATPTHAPPLEEALSIIKEFDACNTVEELFGKLSKNAQELLEVLPEKKRKELITLLRDTAERRIAEKFKPQYS
jgi:hypothetical protein